MSVAGWPTWAPRPSPRAVGWVWCWMSPRARTTARSRAAPTSRALTTTASSCASRNSSSWMNLRMGQKRQSPWSRPPRAPRRSLWRSPWPRSRP
uniref:Putative secreted protein n=1 Tax=Ixodes ricinus TaxID=34613 RepID=A0A6B0U2P4_IXORI